MAVSINAMLRAMHKARDDIERNVVTGLDAELERIFARAERKLYRERKRFYSGLQTDAKGKLVGSVGNIEAASRAVKEAKSEIQRLIEAPGQRWADKTVNVMAEAGRDLARINLNTDYLSQAKIDAVFKHTSQSERRVIRVGKSDTYTIINTVGNDAGEFFRRTMLDSVVDGIPVQGAGDTLTNRLFASGRLRPVTIITKSGRTITRSVKQRAQAIARVESAKILNAVQEAKVTEALGDDAVFKNSNPNDSRTTDICRFASREKPKSMAEWKASSYGKPPRLRPFHLCRSILIGGYAEWFDDEEAVEPVQNAKPSPPIEKPKEVKGPQQLTEIDERIEAYGGQWKRREVVAKGEKVNRQIRKIEKELENVEATVPKRKIRGPTGRMRQGIDQAWIRKVGNKKSELLKKHRALQNEFRGWFFNKFRNADEVIKDADHVIGDQHTQRPEWANMFDDEDRRAIAEGVYELSLDSPMAQGWRGRLDAGTTWVQGLLQKGEGGQGQIDFDAAMAMNANKKMRAFYSNYERGLTTEKGVNGRIIEERTGRAGLVYTDISDPIPTMIHELGHLLEFRIDGIREAAIRFLAYRTRGETPKSLKKELPTFGYRNSEYGKQDDFVKTFKTALHRERYGEDKSAIDRNIKNHAFYTGKEYSDKATEIISMGLELLYNDPYNFAKSDPEFFDFIMGLLDGELRYY